MRFWGSDEEDDIDKIEIERLLREKRKRANEQEFNKRLEAFQEQLRIHNKLRDQGIQIRAEREQAGAQSLLRPPVVVYTTRHPWVLTDADKDFLRVQGIKPE